METVELDRLIARLRKGGSIRVYGKRLDEDDMDEYADVIEDNYEDFQDDSLYSEQDVLERVYEILDERDDSWMFPNRD